MDDNTISFHKSVTVILQDSVNCIITGLIPTHFDYFFKTYNLYIDNYFYNPKVKLGIWDGKVPFFNKAGKTYVNLLPEIIPAIVKLGYKITLKDNRVTAAYDVVDIDNTYFDHIINPKNNKPYILEKHQVDAANAVFAANGGIVLAATGFGKAQPLTARVMSETGWKLMGELVVGEKIITPKNTRSVITGVFPQGKTDTYKLTFSDGSSTEADGNHIWKCFNPNRHLIHSKPFLNFTTSELKNRLETLKSKAARGQIPLTQSIDFGDQDLPFDPYYFSILILHLRINKNGEYKFTSGISAVIQTIEPFLKQYNIYLTCVGRGCNGTLANYNFNFDDEDDEKTIFFFNTLRLLVGDKMSIPYIYKFASAKQRLRFFNGICDTKAMLTDKGRCIVENVTSLILLQELQDMVWMMGAVCSISPPFNTITINHPAPTTLFTNANSIRQFVMHGANINNRILRRTISKIEYIGKVETQCISIDDSDHLYITDDCIVTHNTILNAVVADHYHQTHGIGSLTIVPSTSLINQTADQFELLNLDTGRFDGTRKDIDHTHVVSTWQTLSNYPKYVHRYQLVIVDECHGAQANSLNTLLVKSGCNVPLRVGFTGTLPVHNTTRTTIKVALGDIVYEKAAIELIDNGWLATPNISIMQLNDQDYLRKHGVAKFDEIDYTNHLKILQTNSARLAWIVEFIIEKNISSQKGNILCLVGTITYGKKLQKLIPGSIFLYGADPQEIRKKAYDLFETEDNLTVICTQQIAGVGLSIDRIFNLIFIDMGKSYIKTIQMIGRGLRKGRDKDTVNIIDICSNLPYSNTHLKERVKFYKGAQYAYKKYIVQYDDKDEYVNSE